MFQWHVSIAEAEVFTKKSNFETIGFTNRETHVELRMRQHHKFEKWDPSKIFFIHRLNPYSDKFYG